jgi:predicted KAP-like P-loop ATPase
MNIVEEGNEIKQDESQDKSQLFYDTPLLHPEQDRLNRAPFAKPLAKSILQMDAKHGFVFALHGSWGSGKTTTLNFVLHYEEQKWT